MAIFNCQVNIIGRKNYERNICAVASYRSGEKLKSHDDGLTKYPHRNTSDILHTRIFNWSGSRQTLWNEVEKSENRKNSQLAKEVEVALPKELSQGQRAALLDDIGQQLADKYGVAVDLAMHDQKDGNGNFHAHILFTTRVVEDGKESLGKKNRDMNAKKEMFWIRNDLYAATTNKHLERAGRSERISGEKTGETNTEIHHGNVPGRKEHNREAERRKREAQKLRREVEKAESEYRRELSGAFVEMHGENIDTRGKRERKHIEIECNIRRASESRRESEENLRNPERIRAGMQRRRFLQICSSAVRLVGRVRQSILAGIKWIQEGQFQDTRHRDQDRGIGI